MKIMPISKYQKPAYPDYKLYAEKPEELAKYVPESWKGKKIVLSTFLAFILSGNINNISSGEEKTVANITLNSDESSTDSSANMPAENNPSAQQQVFTAPVFSFGDGRGVIGCIVENAPAFISENEAQQIILEEFQKSGISFDVKNKQIEGISFDKYKSKKKEGTNEFESIKDGVVEVSFDGYNPELNLGFQFISRDEWYKFNEKPWFYWVHAVETKEVAKKLQGKLQQQEKYNSVVFYDPQPITDFESFMKNDIVKSKKSGKPYNNIHEMYSETENEARDMLRSQIHSFLEWLKKENKLQIKPDKKIN